MAFSSTLLSSMVLAAADFLSTSACGQSAQGIDHSPDAGASSSGGASAAASNSSTHIVVLLRCWEVMRDTTDNSLPTERDGILRKPKRQTTTGFTLEERTNSPVLIPAFLSHFAHFAHFAGHSLDDRVPRNHRPKQWRFPVGTGEG